VGIETYNGVVHGARAVPRSAIRGVLMDSLVPIVAEGAPGPFGKRAFETSPTRLTSLLAGSTARPAVRRA
jgi:hypothetical protein